MPEIPSEHVHLIITDPPYFLDGLGTDWKGVDRMRGTGSVGGLPIGMRFDPKQGRDLQAFMEQVGSELLRVLVPGAFAIVFSQPRLVHRMAIAMEESGFEIRDVYAWHYTRRAQAKAFSMNHFVERMGISAKDKSRIKQKLRGRKTAQLRPQFELMVLAQKPRVGTFINNWLDHQVGLVDISATLDGRAPATLMTVEKPDKDGLGHMTMKPPLLIAHLMRLFSMPGQVVLDPFLGSGTTAIVAQQEGRACIGIEINPDYIAMAEHRLRSAA